MSLDSLKQVLLKAPDDTNKTHLLYEIGLTLANDNLDSAIVYYEQAYKLSKDLNFTWGEIKYYGFITEALNHKGNFDEALRLNKEGLAKCFSKNCPALLPNQYLNIANEFIYLQQYDSSIAYYNEARKIYEQTNDTSGLVFVYGNIAEVYLSQNRKKEAVEYATISVKLLAGQPKDRTYRNLLFNLGKDECYVRDYTTALKHLAEAEELATVAQDDYLLALISNEYFNYYLNTGKYAEMPASANRFFKLVEPMQSDMLTATGWQLRAIAAFYTKNFSEAEDCINKSLALFLKTGEKGTLKEVYLLKSSIALVRNQDIAAYQANMALADSFLQAGLDETILKNTQDLEKRYETEKKEQQLKIQAAELSRKNLQNGVLAAAVAVLILLGVLLGYAFYNRQQLNKRQKEIQQQRIAQLEQEKQLAAIQAVLKGQDEERTRLAKDLHDGLGGMLSGIKFSFGTMKDNMVMTAESHQAFERSMDMLDTSIKELRRVAHNMMPESLLKFGLDAALNDLCLQLNSTGAVKATYQSMGLKSISVNRDIALNVYRIVQELLNNIMKHAAATEVLVQTTYGDNAFSITVEDNGKGFDTNAQTKGVGWESIRNRVAYLKGSVDVQSLAGKGTSVFIEFKV
ncbi:MAG: sensor histidine kinase [Chitinophagales bacterium]